MDRLSGLILFIQFIHKMSQDKKVYNNIINSLFPTIHGSNEVKRGIVGVPKTFSSGWNIFKRQNVCIKYGKVTLSKDCLWILTQHSVHQQQG